MLKTPACDSAGYGFGYLDDGVNYRYRRLQSSVLVGRMAHARRLLRLLLTWRTCRWHRSRKLRNCASAFLKTLYCTRAISLARLADRKSYRCDAFLDIIQHGDFPVCTCGVVRLRRSCYFVGDKSDG